MENVMQGTSCTSSQAQTLSVHRRAIMDLLVGHPLITTAEYDTAMQRTLACQDVATLQKWYRNTVREIGRREEQEPVTAPVQYATGAQKEEIIRLCNAVQITRAEKTKALLTLNQLDHAGATALRAELWAKITSRAGCNPAPAPVPTPTPVPTPAVPAWLTLRGRITRAQRQELERRLAPQQATSITARCILDTMGQWSAARATAELLRLGVCNVSLEARRSLCFSVGGTAPAGLLPRRVFAAAKLVRREVTSLCKEYQIAQPGERYDYALFQN